MRVPRAISSGDCLQPCSSTMSGARRKRDRAARQVEPIVAPRQHRRVRRQPAVPRRGAALDVAPRRRDATEPACERVLEARPETHALIPLESQDGTIDALGVAWPLPRVRRRAAPSRTRTFSGASIVRSAPCAGRGKLPRSRSARCRTAPACSSDSTCSEIGLPMKSPSIARLCDSSSRNMSMTACAARMRNSRALNWLRLAQDLAQDLVADGLRRLDLAAAVARRAGLAQHVRERLARALARHLDQAQLREAVDRDAGAVALQRLVELGQHRAAGGPRSPCR